MVAYIVYPIRRRVVSSCMDKTLNSVTGSILDPIFDLVDVMEHLHLLTLSFTVVEELWRYNCMRLDVCEDLDTEVSGRWNHEKSFLMVKHCKELEHLWCASRRSVYGGICRWLRSWLACIAELAGYSRLDENQFDLRTFGSLLILSLGDLYFKQLGIVLTTLRKVELETWNRVYQLRHRLKGVVSRSSELN